MTDNIVPDNPSFSEFLMILERFSPLERTVLLLRDVFECGYDDMAALIDRSEAECRRIAGRNRELLGRGNPMPDSTSQEHERLLEIFMSACWEGNAARIALIFCRDAALYSDGNRQQAAYPSLRGAEQVAAFLLDLVRSFPHTLETEKKAVDGRPVLMSFDDGETEHLLTYRSEKGRIAEVFVHRHAARLN